MGTVLARPQAKRRGGTNLLSALYHDPDPEPAEIFPLLLVLAEKPTDRVSLCEGAAHADGGRYRRLLPEETDLQSPGADPAGKAGMQKQKDKAQ